jgi:hypothetical protein
MGDDKQAADQAELEALRKRSAELIAEVEQINRRINALSAAVNRSSRPPPDPGPSNPGPPDPGPPDPAITDTWADEARRPDLSRFDELP